MIYQFYMTVNPLPLGFRPFIRQNKQFYDFFFEILETLYIKVLVIRVS